MKGTFIFEDNTSLFLEFPQAVTARLTTGESVKGQMFIKSTAYEEMERRMLDEGLTVEIDGEEAKLSDILYVPFVFIRDGATESEEFPPMVVQTEYRGEIVNLYVWNLSMGTKNGSDGSKTPVHVLMFSSEEPEGDWCLKEEEEKEKDMEEMIKNFVLVVNGGLH